MKLNLDLSNLSPTLQQKLIDTIDNLLRKESNQIRIDAENYGDGPTKDEMIGWSNAAWELAKEVTHQEISQRNF